jgi:DNA-binding MarR family transcriptional regulator
MASENDALRVWFRLIRLHTRSRLAVANRLRAFDLSVPQCDVLTTLTEQEGLSQQELASRLYVTKGNISGLIDRLVANGLVERRALQGDRRSHAIHLTPAGREMAQRGVEAQKAFVAQTFGRVAPDRLDLFNDLLVELRDLVRAQNDVAAKEGAAQQGAEV